MMSSKIVAVRGRSVWDSRGLPTVEVDIETEGGRVGRGIAPSGASTGRREAIELRDGGSKLGGKSVDNAVRLVNSVVANALVGLDVTDQQYIDSVLDGLDPDPVRSSIGGNTTTAASLAALHASAAAQGIPAWRVLNAAPTAIPRPQIQIMGGGAHAAHRTAVQDFMAYPLSATTISDALTDVAEVYRAVGDVMARRGPKLGVADEGGHWPDVRDTEDALEVLMSGIELAGLKPGIDMGISLDIAASQFHTKDGYRVGGADYSTAEWIEKLLGICRAYPIITMEDPADEDDAEGMKLAVAGDATVIVGDDYLVTSADRVRRAAASGEIDSVLIKVNQVGTVSGGAAAVAAARECGLSAIVSARSGETEDTSVAHLATGWGADIVKVGSITRSERTAKWNELIRIDEALGGLPLASVVTRTRT